MTLQLCIEDFNKHHIKFIHKKEDIKEPENYRPINLLSVV